MTDPDAPRGTGVAARVASLPRAAQLCLIGLAGLAVGAVVGLGPGLAGGPTVADPGRRRLVGFAGLCAAVGCASLCGGLTLAIVRVGLAAGLVGGDGSEG